MLLTLFQLGTRATLWPGQAVTAGQANCGWAQALIANTNTIARVNKNL